MNIDKKEFLRILGKYRKGEASKEEELFLHAYYNLFDLKESPLEKMSGEEKNLLRDSIRQEMKLKLSKQGSRIKKEKSRNLLKLRWIASALVFITCTIGLWLYRDGIVRTGNTGLATGPSFGKHHDIAPGGNKATLILENGTSVVLDEAGNGIVARQTGAAINKTAEGELVYKPVTEGPGTKVSYNTITIPRGGQYQLTLSDGSKVWLNSASSIRFPTVFSGDERRVEITGEAYFEISKIAERNGGAGRMPFIVVTQHQEVRVLGTHFNINAYEDEGVTETTLLEGSVVVRALSSRLSSYEKELRPGQQSVLSDASGIIKVQEADLEKAVAWKNGFFKFDREDLGSIMRQVSRWYDVTVEYRGKVPQDEFVGKIKRTAYVSGVLRILELSKIKCRLEGRKIIVEN